MSEDDKLFGEPEPNNFGLYAGEPNSFGLYAGQMIAVGLRRSWWRRAWRWFARVVLRRETPQVRFVRIVSVDRNVITFERPLDGDNRLFMSTFYVNKGAPDADR